MKHTKTVQVPACEKVVLDRITCDLCGGVILSKAYTVDEVTIERQHGTNYPDTGVGATVSADVCGDCFATRLIPWLESQGAKPQTEEWDY